MAVLFWVTISPLGREPKFVSLSPSITEILFAIGAGDLVAGVSAPADHPPEASRKEVVASYDGVLFEKIAAMKPDGCLTVSGMQGRDSLEVLRRLGIEVTEYPVATMEDLYACILDVGRKCRKVSRSEALVGEMKKKIALAAADIPSTKERALFLVGLDPVVAVGKGSYLNDLCKAAGFTNVLEDIPPSYSVVSFDMIAALQPDRIIMPEGEITKDVMDEFERKVKMFNKKAKFGEVPADLVMRPGPRVAEGVEKLAALRKGGGK